MKIFHTLMSLIALSIGAAALAQQNAAQQSASDSGNEERQAPASEEGSEQTGASGVVTLSTTVTGNQEQPKVLYIVPWQAAQDERILYEPLNSQTNRVFSHIERSEHLRELEFISELGGNIGE